MNGSCTSINTFKCKKGDIVCDAGKSSLCLTSGKDVFMDLPKSQSWKLRINLHGANVKMCIHSRRAIF